MTKSKSNLALIEDCCGQVQNLLLVVMFVQKSEVVATVDWQRKLARLVSANRQDVFYCRDDQILFRVLRRGRESMNQDLAMLGRYLPFTAIWINLCITVVFSDFSAALLKVKICTLSVEYVFCPQQCSINAKFDLSFVNTFTKSIAKIELQHYHKLPENWKWKFRNNFLSINNPCTMLQIFSKCEDKVKKWIFEFHSKL